MCLDPAFHCIMDHWVKIGEQNCHIHSTPLYPFRIKSTTQSWLKKIKASEILLGIMKCIYCKLYTVYTNYKLNCTGEQYIALILSHHKDNIQITSMYLYQLQ